MTPDEAPSYDAPAARLAVRLVEALCISDQPMGVSELARKIDSNPNMTFRLLHTLEDAGWILRREDAKYEMGLRAFHFTSMPVGRMGLRRAADAPVRRLWETFGESTYLGVVDGTRTLFLEHLDATGDIRLSARPGGRFRMYCAAPGKVLLAFSDPALAEAVVREGLEAQTAHTLVTREALYADLAAIRAQGFGLDREEYATGLICFAAPVFGVDDQVAGTIGVSVLTLHWSFERLCGELGPQVIAAANAASAALGSSRSVAAPITRTP
jgi:DNA-binding IclR family transcriptional regulator